ncbi:hypothetical protein [Porphyromonas catoniae]|jgi:hypothetical protein|uniref:hypothetical protein n=1 Tax=Porphyromonas catoniae TaxID=41976 RepID=UPI0028D6D3F4|nr:hypothetical protein [Porphyromonas catoniae]
MIKLDESFPAAFLKAFEEGSRRPTTQQPAPVFSQEHWLDTVINLMSKGGLDPIIVYLPASYNVILKGSPAPPTDVSDL